MCQRLRDSLRVHRNDIRAVHLIEHPAADDILNLVDYRMPVVVDQINPGKRKRRAMIRKPLSHRYGKLLFRGIERMQ